MEYFVEEEILKSANLCNKGNSCLNKCDNDLCQVYASVNDANLFICVEDNSCNYKEIIGERKICGCPVRIDLYKKYKV